MVWMEFKDASYGVSSVDLARLLISKLKKNGRDVNETKIQKLSYIVYGLYLAAYGECIVNDEKPKAWPYGPVFPKISRFFAKNNIDEMDFSDEIVDNQELNDVIEKTVNAFGKYTAGKLVAWSHTPDSPWSKTKNQEGFKWNTVISDDLTYNYFRNE